MAIYTRAEYMADAQNDPKNAHRKYYGQFVTPGTKARVLSAFGLPALLACESGNLNEIPLAKWDAIVPRLPGSGGFAAAGDWYSLSTGVCLAKEAALQIIESNKP